MTDKIQQARRELLERAWRALANSATGREIGAYLDADPCAPECAETCARASMCSTCSATLSAPSPAGVDGLEVVAWRIGFPNNAGYKVYEQRQPWAYEQYGVPSVIVYEVQELCHLSDAQAIIDGLRGEVAELESTLADNLELSGKRAVRIAEIGHELADAISERDQQAQRIGELEGLLRSCLPALSDGGCAALANRIAATLSAGKEGE